MVDKTPRAAETRDAEKRKQTWTRPSALPTPPERPGIKYRWVRVATLGTADVRNISMRLREGYEPVRAADFPEFHIMSDLDSRFPENIEVGGLVLCAIPDEIVADRSAQMREKSRAQMDSVDNTYLRENNPAMPLLKPERTSQSNFGKG